MSHTGWIGVDLDGTLAHYDGWVSDTHIGAAIPRMLKRVRTWLAEGKTVKLVTARVCAHQTPETVARFHKAWAKWCFDNAIPILEVTASKDFRMIELYDDRARQVEPNTGRLLDETLSDAVRGIKRTVSMVRSFLSFVRQNDLPEDGQVQLMNLQDQCDRMCPASPAASPPGEDEAPTDGRGVSASVIPGLKIL